MMMIEIVTPYVGVWIETAMMVHSTRLYRVTPYVGVWIETGCKNFSGKTMASHPTWVCGLKLWISLAV